MRARSFHVPRAVRVPLFCYLAVSLGVPLVNAGWWRSEFWAHACVVSAVALLLTGLRLVIGSCDQSDTRYKA